MPVKNPRSSWLDQLLSEASATFARFRIVILMAILSTFLAIIEIHYDNRPFFGTLHLVSNGLLICSLGISLMTGLTLLSEQLSQKHPTSRLRYTPILIGLVLLVLYFYLLPEKPRPTDSYRYALFFIAAHFFVAFAPFLISGLSSERLWEFNKTLFLRGLLTGVYAGILMLGLMLALLGMDHLLGVDVKAKIYVDLLAIIGYIFATWFFLAGVPRPETLNAKPPYPKALKVFIKYVAIPLSTLYLLIIYAYMTKIIVSWELPKGFVSIFILIFAVSAILTYLLLYPLREEPNENLIWLFARGLHYLLIPLAGLLFVAVGRRIRDYGITEDRYFVVLIGAWILGISLYFTLSGKKKITVVPVSLAILTFLSAVGPWSAFSVSKWSQLRRFKAILAKHNILVNDQLQKSQVPLPKKDVEELEAILSYFWRAHEMEDMAPWLQAKGISLPLEDPSNRGGRYVYTPSDEILAKMSIQAAPSESVSEVGSLLYYIKAAHNWDFIDVGGYEYLIQTDVYYADDEKTETYDLPNNLKAIISHSKDSLTKLTIWMGGEKVLVQELSQSLKDLILKRLQVGKDELPPSAFVQEVRSEKVQAKIIIEKYAIEVKDRMRLIPREFEKVRIEDYESDSFKAYLLIKLL